MTNNFGFFRPAENWLKSPGSEWLIPPGSNIAMNIDDNSKYIGIGLITMAAPEKLETALEFGDGYAIVTGSDYTIRVKAQQ